MTPSNMATKIQATFRAYQTRKFMKSFITLPKHQQKIIAEDYLYNITFANLLVNKFEKFINRKLVLWYAQDKPSQCQIDNAEFGQPIVEVLKNGIINSTKKDKKEYRHIFRLKNKYNFLLRYNSDYRKPRYNVYYGIATNKPFINIEWILEILENEYANIVI